MIALPHIAWPALTGDPPLVAQLKSRPEDFLVDEVLAFAPSGQGEHLYLHIQKRGISAMQLVGELSRRLCVARDDVGTAGLKDTHAITRQWVSVPRSCAIEERVRDAGVWDDELQVLEAVPHGHKLRTGLLRGNEFVVRLRACQGEDVQATLTRRWAKLGELGMLNAFGAQRFGRDNNTLALGLELLGDPRRSCAKQLRRLALSAVQAALFNRWLYARVQADQVHQVIEGDVMQVIASGGPFWADDVAEVQGRVQTRQVVVSGPIFGPKMRRARGQAQAAEEAVLHEAHVTLEQFGAQGRLCQGTRRAAVVWPQLRSLRWEDADTCVLAFFLPAGSYATELVSALLGSKASA